MMEIKDCPFCKCEGVSLECLPTEYETGIGCSLYQVYCWNCFMRGPRDVRKLNAIKKWNELPRDKQ